MSKGLGWVERAVLDALRTTSRTTAKAIAAHVHRVGEDEVNLSQLNSVRRALHRLTDKGLAKGQPRTSGQYFLEGSKRIGPQLRTHR